MGEYGPDYKFDYFGFNDIFNFIFKLQKKMKLQDILFFIVFLILIYKRKPEWFAGAGLICLILSIPLFSLWVFFTAQRLVYYAAGFFIASIILFLIQLRKK